ncbi:MULTISPECIES: 3-hydroxyacyl-ACP dehydratase FabZ [Pseudoxanthomonas]|jgi:3-hydroxyacyl-[acyl-carrier-protein] dehydratase|uniref:3-hydroxyacyl-[acyl-carrier-protein] dehydratase FabZ n=1 Tax=Pseudoxanthomonas winnipegensis TaxID=2480810 RepID=A0A4Q8LA75_9GAMM|nr:MULTISPECIES: 3-hydroxyacyl-ACP dehydratase FabZ [Pseudoxanthomonas]PZP63339.1 MAG: 3-hydroxyacyl-[acyl-carrier-protein] dehydratase FabZ [Pseudoxanthomonas spadix]MDQ1118638.1 3-hydroxyacyl-[acyl-carrier-protein] dehydratase [Pseudoxanthomonas winnipegensis]MDQ1131821.1 3-hydroxyacyl-[acyl-carrier-protein] dehydratase [Pseudoxanthomonas winnipegensis]MDR6138158.1 3-hydroxyacyl-[acyl-carrier-protein] dehydratase [Pseudoxanthomonas sp. SORGH_AS_0997]RZZ82733.1 3-hydroxyacyl-ACP dehydratase F
MTMNLELPLTIETIQRLLPHRYPFLLVDRVTELEPDTRIKAYKNVTFNEPFFMGHFPERSVMPGVLIIEALAQAGGLITQIANGEAAACKLFYLVKVENVKFSAPVVPGDRLEMEVTIKRKIRNMAVYEGIARVDGKQVACAEMLCAEVDKGKGD